MTIAAMFISTIPTKRTDRIPPIAAGSARRFSAAGTSFPIRPGFSRNPAGWKARGRTLWCRPSRSDRVPNDRWTYGIKGEVGRVSDEAAGDMKRHAVGLSAAYKYKNLKYASALEYRHEDGTIENRDTWLLKNSLGLSGNALLAAFGEIEFFPAIHHKGHFLTAIIRGGDRRGPASRVS